MTNVSNPTYGCRFSCYKLHMEALWSIYCWLAQLDPAVWVALFALALSIVVASQNWEHNRLSVLPNIDVHRNTISRTLMIESSGVGPAIIDEITVTMENKSYNLSTLEGMSDFYTRYGNIIASNQVLGEGVFLLPGEKRNILNFKDIEENLIGEFLSHLSFSIKWKSVYGEEFNVDLTNSLEIQKS